MASGKGRRICARVGGRVAGADSGRPRGRLRYAHACIAVRAVRTAGARIDSLRSSRIEPSHTMSELGESPLAAGDRHLSVDEARAAIAAALQPVDGIERVPLTQALGRVLAAEVVSPIDVPAHDNSAMDGYALRRRRLAADADHWCWQRWSARCMPARLARQRGAWRVRSHHDRRRDARGAGHRGAAGAVHRRTTTECA
jgi:hypothetical protein